MSGKRKAELRVGDLVYNRITHEEGRIVRIVSQQDIERLASGVSSGLAYVVAVSPNGIWPEREVLWRERAVDTLDKKKAPNTETDEV